LVLAGCFTPVRPEVDDLVCGSAGRPLDMQPPETAKTAFGPTPLMDTARRPDSQFDDIMLAALQETKGGNGPKETLDKKLTPPSDLEGSNLPKFTIPLDKNGKPDLPKLREIVQKYFPPLPDLGPDPQPLPGPGGKPLALGDLQQLARATSPLLRQAASDVVAARWTMVQAGAYPNPTIGLQGTTDSPSGGPTFGPIFEQTIKTMGKLKLAQAAAQMDYENAKLAYRRAETDLMASIRTSYFAVLVAQENMRQNHALAELTDKLYKVMVSQLKGGELAFYEPMQVGVFSGQARAALLQSRNSYLLAWKQLASNLGLVEMQPTELAGNIRHMPMPIYRYDACLVHVLSSHTDVGTADNVIARARYSLRLAEVTAIPDINVQAGVSNDETQPGPNRISGNFQVSFPVPIWDLNRGGIAAARAALMRANEEPHRVRDDLTARVADAFRRQRENFDLLQLYQKDILPKQVQAYVSSVRRYFGGEIGGVAFNDIITAEQNLVTVMSAYLSALQNEWQAVADLGSLLQTDDIFQMAEGQHFAQPPDLSQLAELPCCHACSPMPAAHLKPPDLTPPEAGGDLVPPPTLLGPPRQQAPAGSTATIPGRVTSNASTGPVLSVAPASPVLPRVSTAK
jgi:cobalt-zinc-cadmium efflux system outer membrane protein